MFYVLVFLFEFILLFLLSRVLVKFISQLFMRVARSEGLAIRLFHLFLLPGVIIHELAHLIVAEVMLVRTGGLSFTPEPDEDKIVMGSVGIEETDPIRRAIIGFAPVFIGILIISFFVFFFFSENNFSILFIILIVLSVPF